MLCNKNVLGEDRGLVIAIFRYITVFNESYFRKLGINVDLKDWIVVAEYMESNIARICDEKLYITPFSASLKISLENYYFIIIFNFISYIIDKVGSKFINEKFKQLFICYVMLEIHPQFENCVYFGMEGISSDYFVDYKYFKQSIEESSLALSEILASLDLQNDIYTKMKDIKRKEEEEKKLKQNEESLGETHVSVKESLLPFYFYDQKFSLLDEVFLGNLSYLDKIKLLQKFSIEEIRLYFVSICLIKLLDLPLDINNCINQYSGNIDILFSGNEYASIEEYMSVLDLENVLSQNRYQVKIDEETQKLFIEYLFKCAVKYLEYLSQHEDLSYPYDDEYKKIIHLFIPYKSYLETVSVEGSEIMCKIASEIIDSLGKINN